MITLGQIYDKVLVLIDEIQIGGLVNSINLIDRVYPCIDTAIRQIKLSAPLSHLGTIHPTANPHKNDDGSGYIVLPNDFLRLGSFMMKGWMRPCFESITTDDRRYFLQRNQVTRGNKERPIVAIVRTSEHIRLEYYSLSQSDDHVVTMIDYIKDEPISVNDDRSKTIAIDQSLFDNVCESAAKLCLQVGVITNK